jgi:hypothetical protein
VQAAAAGRATGVAERADGARQILWSHARDVLALLRPVVDTAARCAAIALLASLCVQCVAGDADLRSGLVATTRGRAASSACSKQWSVRRQTPSHQRVRCLGGAARVQCRIAGAASGVALEPIHAAVASPAPCDDEQLLQRAAAEVRRAIDLHGIRVQGHADAALRVIVSAVCALSVAQSALV